MRSTYSVFILLVLLLLGCSPVPKVSSGQHTLLNFGSCLRQWQPQPVWDAILEQKASAFIFLGDNMYSDVGDYLKQTEPNRIKQAYDDLAGTEAFKKFLTQSERQNLKLFATWDDHDYGLNDGGGSYPHRLSSKAYFLDFFNLSETVTGGTESPGIYQSYFIEAHDLQIQLILLDTRSFRSPLKKSTASLCKRTTGNIPDNDPHASLLGSQQWQWLERELVKPADLRIIASSIQVIPQEHCFEKWANFPLEREALFQLIQRTEANGVVFISGDRHLGEISKLPSEVIGYPLYEVTASGLNSAMGLKARAFREVFQEESNQFRLNAVEYRDNFGSIGLFIKDHKPHLSLRIHRANGEISQAVDIPLNSLHI